MIHFMPQQVAFVLYVARSSMALYSVHGRSGRVRIDTHLTAAWDDDSLSDVLDELFREIPAKRVSLVFDDSVVYRSEFSITLAEDQDLLESVYTDLRTRIPEEFSPKEVFLYAVKTQKKLARGYSFVPVSFVYQTLLQKAKDFDIVFGAFLTEHEASLRNGDPVVEGALKDETCITYGRKHIRWPIVFVRVAVGIVVLCLLGASSLGVYWWQTGKVPGIPQGMKGSDNLQQPILSLPTPEPTPPPPTPQPTAFPQGYRVLIQNGTGIAGRAEEVALEFQEERVLSVDTANADRFSYEETTVLLKPRPEMDAMLTWTQETLKMSELREISVLPIDAEYDLIVIVGQDAL